MAVEQIQDISGYLSHEQLEQMLDEIAGFEIRLEEDPTLPNLRNKYLQQTIAQCRAQTNRVHFYLQQARRFEKNVRVQLKEWELDVELKMAELLADDSIVRDQPSIEDRKALAITRLKPEHERLADLRVAAVDLSDTIRIIKSKYDELKATSRDIVLQRQMVKDDAEFFGKGMDSYTPPQARKDGTIPDGLTPPVRPGQIDPRDLLDPSKRPDDLPEPKDAQHAAHIAAFFNGAAGFIQEPPKKEEAPETPPPEPAKLAGAASGMSYDDLLSS